MEASPLVNANTCGIRILHIYQPSSVPYMLLGSWPNAHVAAPTAGCLHLATKGKMKCRASEANLYKPCQSGSAECVKLSPSQPILLVIDDGTRLAEAKRRVFPTVPRAGFGAPVVVIVAHCFFSASGHLKP